MVGLINKIADKIVSGVNGIQIGFDRERLSVGDISGLVVVQIRRIEGGIFQKAEAGANYNITIELYTRSLDVRKWYEKAEQIIEVLNGERVEDYFLPLDFISLVFFGLKDNFYYGEISFVTKSFRGKL